MNTAAYRKTDRKRTAITLGVLLGAFFLLDGCDNSAEQTGVSATAPVVSMPPVPSQAELDAEVSGGNLLGNQAADDSPALLRLVEHGKDLGWNVIE